MEDIFVLGSSNENDPEEISGVVDINLWISGAYWGTVTDLFPRSIYSKTQDYIGKVTLEPFDRTFAMVKHGTVPRTLRSAMFLL